MGHDMDMERQNTQSNKPNIAKRNSSRIIATVATALHDEDPVVESLQQLIHHYQQTSVKPLYWQVVGHPTLPPQVCGCYERAKSIQLEMGEKSLIVPIFA